MACPRAESQRRASHRPAGGWPHASWTWRVASSLKKGAGAAAPPPAMLLNRLDEVRAGMIGYVGHGQLWDGRVLTKEMR